MDHDDGAVFAGEIHFYVVDLHNADFASAKRFAPDRHFLALVIDHMDIYCVGMHIRFHFIGGKGKVNSLIRGNVKRIPDTHIIGGKAHDPAEEGTVCTVAFICSGEGSVKGELHFFQGRCDHLLGKKSDPRRTCGMRTGRTDHIRAHNVKYADKRHFS